ncbi:MAG: TerC/Alx family metal homeostasis membrane protein, partial [bacterium]|nr:TerC/Alx family metal homeostasis membrane protein [bacterium]
VMRALFIVTGAALIHRFHWIIDVFGAFLLCTGVKLLLHRGGEIHPERNPVMKVFRRFIPLTSDYRGARFVVKEGGRWLATPLLMVLVVVEATDIVFAVDSIPAIFAITTDPFIVFTSNIFAILGLRALYFLLAGMMGRFHYLKVGLGLVLAFVGVKMLLVDVGKLPVAVSLGVIAALLGGSIVASLLRPVSGSGEGTPPDHG